MCVVLPHHLFAALHAPHLLGKGDAALSRCIPLAIWLFPGVEPVSESSNPYHRNHSQELENDPLHLQRTTQLQERDHIKIPNGVKLLGARVAHL